MASIDWLTLEWYALDAAQTTHKPLLLDFFNPQRIGY